jgi:hypothetical protein
MVHPEVALLKRASQLLLLLLTPHLCCALKAHHGTS